MGLNITAKIEDDGLMERFREAGDEAKEAAKPIVKEVALAGVKAVKSEMPVDTGRARASWGIWTPGDIRESSSDQKQGDAVFTVSGDGLTVTQGTNVGYVEQLDKGTSEQAPAGFIDRVAERMGNALMEKISQMLDDIL
jgi:HK97 gp10 family phage protein